MEWTKLPIDLIQSGASDKEILSIVKYQMIWAMLERQPTEAMCMRYMTTRQYQQALDYASAIQRRVNADIKSVENHRHRQKIYYQKNQELDKKPDGHTDCHTDVLDKIREDKIRYSPPYIISPPTVENTKINQKNKDDEERQKNIQEVERWTAFINKKGYKSTVALVSAGIEEFEKLKAEYRQGEVK